MFSTRITIPSMKSWGGGGREKRWEQVGASHFLHGIFHKWEKWRPKRILLPFKWRRRMGIVPWMVFMQLVWGPWVHLHNRAVKMLILPLIMRILVFPTPLKPACSCSQSKNICYFLIKNVFPAPYRKFGEIQNNKENENHPMIPPLFIIWFALPFVSSKWYYRCTLIKIPQFSVAALICVFIKDLFFSIM